MDQAHDRAQRWKAPRFGARLPDVLLKDSLNPVSFQKTRQLLQDLVTEGVAPGGVVGVWRASDPGVMLLQAEGHRRIRPSEQSLEVDTVFDIASVTKVFATASLAATLVERRWIRWESPLAAYLPEYPYKDIKLRDLLSHTAGLPAWAPLWQSLRERLHATDGGEIARIPVLARQREMRRLIEAIVPEAQPGERMVYSDICFLLLGFALEEASGMPFEDAVRRLVWEPMGIRGAFFRKVSLGVIEGQNPDVAATEDCPWRGGVLQGQVHDDNCWAMGGVAGHAGAFARAEDLLRFGASWLSHFYSDETRRDAWSRVLSPAGCSRTLGWDTPSGEETSAGRYFSKDSVGHLGFTGTSLWIDPVRGWVVTLLTNRVHFGRENQKIRGFRHRFHTQLAEELLKLDAVSSY